MSLGRFLDIHFVGDGYEIRGAPTYYSPRYNRSLTFPDPFYSDGATWARDLPHTDAWAVHDLICRYGVWDDGTRIDNWTAATVLADLLWRDGHKAEAFFWWWGSYLFGGGAARKNGMRRIK